MERNNNKLSVL